MKLNSTLNLGQFIPYRLSVLTNKVSALIAQAYESSFGLRIPEWRVIAVLGESPGLASIEIVDRTAMDKATLSRTIRALIAKELIQKKASKQDGRVAHLYLTQAGNSIYQEIVPVALNYESMLLQVLNPEERNQLDELIQKLQESVDRLHFQTQG